MPTLSSPAAGPAHGNCCFGRKDLALAHVEPLSVWTCRRKGVLREKTSQRPFSVMGKAASVSGACFQASGGWVKFPHLDNRFEHTCFERKLGSKAEKGEAGCLGQCPRRVGVLKFEGIP